MDAFLQIALLALFWRIRGILGWPFKLWFWSDPKYLLDWRGAWNAVYFGAIFAAILTGVVNAAT